MNIDLHKKTTAFLYAVSICVIFSACQSNSEIDSKRIQIDLQAEKENLGRLFFFDQRLSIDNSISCATCHKPELAFTDGETKSKGVYGKRALRNAPSLLNVKDLPHFMFDGAVPTLEMQAIIPIQDQNEMGFNMGKLVHKLQSDSVYAKKSIDLYKRKLDAFVITRSLAAYQRTLISENSKFDDFVNSNFKKGLSTEAKKGWKLFSEKFGCISCHALPHFTSYEMKVNHLTKITELDQGRYRITGDSLDIGKFKIPSLRNVEITSPYMHDGSINTLEEVLSKYELNRSKFENPKMRLFQPTADEKKSLLAFLKALTGKSYRVN